MTPFFSGVAVGGFLGMIAGAFVVGVALLLLRKHAKRVGR